MSIIALDYDGTYTDDPVLWELFIKNALNCGHTVLCITMRYPETEKIALNIPVYYTKRQSKMNFCKANNIDIDIWIDDKPGWIFDDAPSYEPIGMS